jgi:hypothetical protein
MSALNIPAPRKQRMVFESRMLAAACMILIVLLPIGVAVYWALATNAALAIRVGLPPDAILGSLLPWQRVAGGLLTELPLVLLLMGLWEARRCFLLFAAGRIFTSETVLCLKRFAGWTMASVIAGVPAATAIAIVISLNNPPGLQQLVVSIGSDQVLLLFFAGMVWLIAGVLSQGQLLAEENATFV